MPCGFIWFPAFSGCGGTSLAGKPSASSPSSLTNWLRFLWMRSVGKCHDWFFLEVLLGGYSVLVLPVCLVSSLFWCIGMPPQVILIVVPPLGVWLCSLAVCSEASIVLAFSGAGAFFLGLLLLLTVQGFLGRMSYPLCINVIEQAGQIYLIKCRLLYCYICRPLL